MFLRVKHPVKDDFLIFDYGKLEQIFSEIPDNEEDARILRIWARYIGTNSQPAIVSDRQTLEDCGILYYELKPLNE